jgi:hypothetical protein
VQKRAGGRRATRVSNRIGQMITATGDQSNSLVEIDQA